MRTRIVKETSTDGKVKYRCEKCITFFFGLVQEWETMMYRIPKELGDGAYGYQEGSPMGIPGRVPDGLEDP